MKEVTSEVLFNKEMMDKAIEDGALFLLEEYLDQLPFDWFDCVQFIAFQGMDDEDKIYPPLVILDDEQTTKLFKAAQQEEIKVFVINEEKNKIWNILLSKQHKEDDDSDVRIIIGGENLRKFCDDKDIYYASHVNEDGSLMSATTMKELKNPGEDCRVPFKDVVNA